MAALAHTELPHYIKRCLISSTRVREQQTVREDGDQWLGGK